jgi:FAD synthase
MIQQPKRGERFTVVRSEGPLDNALRGAVVGIGNFDGVHRGHRAVIAAARTRAQVLGRPAAALTFEPHPRRFFSPDEPLFRLTDEQAKLRLLSGAGLDGAVCALRRTIGAAFRQDFVSQIWSSASPSLASRSASTSFRSPVPAPDCVPWAGIRFCRGHRAAL